MLIALNRYTNEEEILMWYYNENNALMTYYSGDGLDLISIYFSMSVARKRVASYHTIIHDDGED